MPLEFELCPGRVVGGDHPCFIIAEIGQNHQGDIEIAKKMIKMAKVTHRLQSDSLVTSTHRGTNSFFLFVFSFNLTLCVDLEPLNFSDRNHLRTSL